MKKRLSLVAFFLIAVAVLLAMRFGLDVRSIAERSSEWLRSQGDLGLVWLALAYIPASLLFFPAWLLTVGGAFVFGMAKTLVAVSLGSTVGATSAFLAGRTLLRHVIEHKVETDARFRTLDQAVADQGFKIVMLTRLSPVLPFNLLNYAFGLTKVRLRDFVLASWIGMFPGTLLYVSLGSAAKNLSDVFSGRTESSLGQKVLFGLGVFATLAVTVILARISRNALTTAIKTPDGNERESSPNES